LALAGIAVALITLFFAGWVALELYLGPSLSTDGQFRLHIVRGVTTSILVALFVLYWSERRVRQAEEIVKHRELHLARVLKESVDAIVGIDRHGNVVYWNRGAELLYGYHPAEILGQSFQKLVPNGIRSTKAATPALLARGEHIQEFLTERMTKSGEAVSVMVTQTALGKEVRECTGCRALEQGLSDVRKLEHQVIHTEQLATVGEMAAGLAHEIKNPLAGIAGAIQVLGDTLPEGD
jgi:PAS domain S-box-containing protein